MYKVVLTNVKRTSLVTTETLVFNLDKERDVNHVPEVLLELFKNTSGYDESRLNKPVSMCEVSCSEKIRGRIDMRHRCEPIVG